MRWIDLIDPLSLQLLINNHREQEPLKGTRGERDFEPIVKLSVAGTNMLWLLTECDPGGIAFGLCQIHEAELGYVDLQEIADLNIPGVTVTQDTDFMPTTTLRGYAKLARESGGLLIL